MRKSPGPPVITTFVLVKSTVSAEKVGPLLKGVVGAPIVRRVAVRLLVVIELVKRVLMDVLFITTLDAAKRRVDEFA